MYAVDNPLSSLQSDDQSDPHRAKSFPLTQKARADEHQLGQLAESSVPNPLAMSQGAVENTSCSLSVAGSGEKSSSQATVQWARGSALDRLRATIAPRWQAGVDAKNFRLHRLRQLVGEAETRTGGVRRRETPDEVSSWQKVTRFCLDQGLNVWSALKHVEARENPIVMLMSLEKLASLHAVVSAVHGQYREDDWDSGERHYRDNIYAFCDLLHITLKRNPQKIGSVRGKRIFEFDYYCERLAKNEADLYIDYLAIFSDDIVFEYIGRGRHKNKIFTVCRGPSGHHETRDYHRSSVSITWDAASRVDARLFFKGSIKFNPPEIKIISGQMRSHGGSLWTILADDLGCVIDHADGRRYRGGFAFAPGHIPPVPHGFGQTTSSNGELETGEYVRGAYQPPAHRQGI